MFGGWSREIERSEWRGRVDQTLKDLSQQNAAIGVSVEHLHTCLESRIAPLVTWHNRLIGVFIFLSVALPVVLWLLTNYRMIGVAAVGGAK